MRVVGPERSPWSDPKELDDEASRGFWHRAELPRWALLLFVCLVLVVRGRVMLSMNDNLERDPDMYSELADNLHQGWTFGIFRLSRVSNQYELQPTAYR